MHKNTKVIEFLLNFTPFLIQISINEFGKIFKNSVAVLICWLKFRYWRKMSVILLGWTFSRVKLHCIIKGKYLNILLSELKNIEQCKQCSNLITISLAFIKEKRKPMALKRLHKLMIFLDDE